MHPKIMAKVEFKGSLMQNAADAMTDALLHLYRELRDRAAHLPPTLVPRLGCPFLICPRNEWPNAMHRILIVGQEPWWWGFEAGHGYNWPYNPIWTLADFIRYDHSPKALMDAYRETTYEIEPDDNQGAPFARALNDFREPPEPHGTIEVINTNLIRSRLFTDDRQGEGVCMYNAPPDELRNIQNWQGDCLTREVEMLNPTAVIFLTGPYYNQILLDQFRGTRLMLVGNLDRRKCAQILHASLPSRSFRTYHPKFLVRSNQWSLLTEIRNRVMTVDDPG